MTPMHYNGSQVGDDKVRWSLKWWPRQLEAGHCGSLIAIGLNPSTATVEVGRAMLDPTLRRLEAIRRRERLECVVMLNLWPLRATDPADLAVWLGATPPETLALHVRLSAYHWRHPPTPGHGPRIWLPCWGSWSPSRCVGQLQAKEQHRLCIAKATDALRDVPHNSADGGDRVVCLGRTATGQPRHPLYTRADAPLEPWP